jgi:hypothetical protein
MPKCNVKIEQFKTLMSTKTIVLDHIIDPERILWLRVYCISSQKRRFSPEIPMYQFTSWQLARPFVLVKALYIRILHTISCQFIKILYFSFLYFLNLL